MLADTSPINIEEIFAKFPNEEYWKFFIDQKKWPLNDPYVFDKDQSSGYFNSMSLALLMNLLAISEPLTPEFIIGLHSIAYHSKDSSGYRQGFVVSGTSGISEETFTFEGLTELYNKSNKSHLYYFMWHVMDKETKACTSFPFHEYKTAAELWQAIQDRLKDSSFDLYLNKSTLDIESGPDVITAKYIERYYVEIILAGDDNNKKLSAIVNFIQDMHQYHPFGDGNGRTFIFLLLNKLLIQNNLLPTIIAEPGRFTGHSIAELIHQIKRGQETFKELCANTGATKTEGFLDFIRRKINITPELEKEIHGTMLDRFYVIKTAIQEQNYDKIYKIIRSNLPDEIFTFLNEFDKHIENIQTQEVKVYGKYLVKNLFKLEHIGLLGDDSYLRAIIYHPQKGHLITKLANRFKKSELLDNLVIRQFLVSYILAQPSEKCVPENEQDIMEACDQLSKLLIKANLFEHPRLLSVLKSHPAIIHELSDRAPLLESSGKLSELHKFIDNYNKDHSRFFPESENLKPYDFSDEKSEPPQKPHASL